MNLPIILEAAAKLGSSNQYLLPVAPTLDTQFLDSLMIRKLRVHYVSEARPALYHSRGGIIASGTATVEAAMMGTPFVMVYRVSGLTYLLGKPRIKVSHFAMVNLIAGEEVVPELVQQNFTAEKVVARLNEVLPYGPARDKMTEGFARVKSRLRGENLGPGHPSERAAEAVLEVCRLKAPV
jgi:lipid-A-disaccharide synthase